MKAKLARSLGALGVAAVALAVTACAQQPAPAPTPTATPTASPTATAEPSYFDQLPESIQKSGVINFVVEPKPPFNMPLEDGGFGGLNADLRELLAEKLGVEFEGSTVSGGLAPMLSTVSSGRADVFFGPLVDTLEREGEHDFVDWILNRNLLLTLDGKFDGDDPLAVCGSPVGIVQDSVLAKDVLAEFNEACAAAGAQPVEIVEQASTSDNLLGLESGRISATLYQADQAGYLMQTRPDFYAVYLLEPGSGGLISHTGIVTAKDTGLSDVLLAVMTELYESGDLLAILETYGLADFLLEPVKNTPAE